MKWIEFFIKKPFLVFVVWGLIISFGIRSFLALPVSFLPANKYLTISVITQYIGASKEKVLDEVTKKLEQSFFQNLSRVENIYSTTRDEISQIDVDFKASTSEEEAISNILFAVSQAKSDLPEKIGIPDIRTLKVKNLPLFTLAATSTLPQPEFYDFVKNQLEPHFTEIPGISHLKTIGQRQKQAVIFISPEKLKEWEISVAEVISRLKRFGVNAFLNHDIPYFLSGEFSSLEDLRSVPLRLVSSGKVVTLKDIAEVKEDLTKPSAYTYFNSEPCLFLEVYSRTDADLYHIEKIFSKKIREIEKKYPKQKLSLHLLANREPNIVSMITDFKINLMIAIAIAIAIIWIVFKDFRSVIVSSTSIPASLCGCFIVLHLLGYSINIYIIMALLVSIGLVIDDIIIIRENIFRHLESGLSPMSATMRGIHEMLNPVIGTTFAIMAVIVPLTFVEKTRSNQNLEDFGVALLVALIFSLVEALTLGPVLCAYFLKPTDKRKTISFSFSAKTIEAVYRHPYRVAFCVVLFLVGGIMILPAVPLEGDQRIPVGVIEIHENVNDNVNLEDLNQWALKQTQELKIKYPDIKQIGTCVEPGKEVFYIQMVPEGDRELSASQLALQLEAELESMKKNKQLESFYLSNNVIPILKYTPFFSLQLIGDHLLQLENYSKKIYDVLESSGRFIDFVNSSLGVRNEYLVGMEYDQMSHLAVEMSSYLNELDVFLNGKELKDIKYHPKHTTDAIKSEIRIEKMVQDQFPHRVIAGYTPNINHMLIPFRMFSQINKEQTKTLEIRRKNNHYLIELSGDRNVLDQNLITKSGYSIPLRSNPVPFAEKVLKEEMPPQGINFEWGGLVKVQKDTQNTNRQLRNISFLLIYLTLLLLYKSATLPFFIFLPLPLSFFGSLSSLFIAGDSINNFSILGIAISLGVAVKNAIILVTYTLQLIEEGIPFSEAVLSAAKIRCRPILMTSIGVLLTALPIFIKWNDYSMLQFSLGISLVGGIIVSVMISLCIIPILFRYAYPLHQKISKNFSPF